MDASLSARTNVSSLRPFSLPTSIMPRAQMPIDPHHHKLIIAFDGDTSSSRPFSGMSSLLLIPHAFRELALLFFG